MPTVARMRRWTSSANQGERCERFELKQHQRFADFRQRSAKPHLSAGQAIYCAWCWLIPVLDRFPLSGAPAELHDGVSELVALRTALPTGGTEEFLCMMSTRCNSGCSGVAECRTPTTAAPLPLDPAPSDSATATAENPSFDAAGSAACADSAEVPSKFTILAEAGPPPERFYFTPGHSCPGCAHVVRDPVRLECGVVVCRGCVLLWSQVEEELERSGSGACAGDRCHLNPACGGHSRPPTQVEVASLPADEAAAEAVARWYAAHDNENPTAVPAPPKCGLCDETEAAFRCGECALPFGLCEACWTCIPVHVKRPAAHIRLPLGAAVAKTKTPTPLCETHGKPLEGYCFTESRLVCAVCEFVTCKTHNAVPVSAATERLTADVQQCCSAVSATSERLREATSAIARLQEQAATHERVVLEGIASAETQIQRAVNERFAQVRSKVQLTFRRRQDALGAQKASLTSLTAALTLRARGLQCAATTPTGVSSDHPGFPASLRPAVAAGAVLESLARRLQNAGVHQAAATFAAYSDVGVEAAAAAIREACTVTGAPKIPVPRLDARQVTTHVVKAAWRATARDERLSGWRLSVTVANGGISTVQEEAPVVEWAADDRLDIPVTAGAGVAAKLSGDYPTADDLTSREWIISSTPGVVVLPLEVSSVWLRWPSVSGRSARRAVIAIQALAYEVERTTDPELFAVIRPFTVASPAATVTLHHDFAVRMTRGPVTVPDIPRLLLELPGDKIAVASSSKLLVISTATGKALGLAAAGVAALALVNDSHGVATPVFAQEDADRGITTLRALTVEGGGVLSAGPELCELPGVGHTLHTVGEAGTGLLSLQPGSRPWLLLPTGFGGFSAAVITHSPALSSGAAVPASDQFVALDERHLCVLRGFSAGAASVTVQQLTVSSAKAPFCAVSSRNFAAATVHKGGDMHAVQVFDDAGFVNSILLVMNTRRSAAPAALEKRAWAPVREDDGGLHGEPARLQPCPGGDRLYTLEHPIEGGSVLKVWSKSARGASHLGERRSAAVVTALLLLKDGRVAYATCEGVIMVVQAL